MRVAYLSILNNLIILKSFSQFSATKLVYLKQINYVKQSIKKVLEWLDYVITELICLLRGQQSCNLSSKK